MNCRPWPRSSEAYIFATTGPIHLQSFFCTVASTLQPSIDYISSCEFQHSKYPSPDNITSCELRARIPHLTISAAVSSGTYPSPDYISSCQSSGTYPSPDYISSGEFRHVAPQLGQLKASERRAEHLPGAETDVLPGQLTESAVPEERMWTGGVSGGNVGVPGLGSSPWYNNRPDAKPRRTIIRS